MKWIFRLLFALFIMPLIVTISFSMVLIINAISIVWHLNLKHIISYRDITHEQSVGVYWDCTDHGQERMNKRLAERLGKEYEKRYTYFATCWDYLRNKKTVSNSYPKAIKPTDNGTD